MLSITIIKEMQIKTILRHYFPLISMATIKNPESSQCWQGYREIGTLAYNYGKVK